MTGEIGTEQRDKHEKFRQLAEKRVNRALKDIRSISKLANPKNYQYTDDEAKKIVRALRTEVRDLEATFRGEEKDSNDFKL